MFQSADVLGFLLFNYGELDGELLPSIEPRRLEQLGLRDLRNLRFDHLLPLLETDAHAVNSHIQRCRGCLEEFHGVRRSRCVR